MHLLKAFGTRAAYPYEGLEIGAWSSRRVHFAPRFGLIPNLPTSTTIQRSQRCESKNGPTTIRNPPLRDPRNPWVLAREGPVRAS
eukprot:4941964-Alexandrium_andersonii.AAC.1